MLNHSDPGNDYVNSVTVIDGLNFCMKEEYHVVHHQFAGIHWSRHKELYDKYKDEYVKAKATIFYKENLFVIFGAIVGQDYKKLAELYYDPGNKTGMTMEEKAELMKVRLQCHGKEVAKVIGRSGANKKASEAFQDKEIKAD